MKRLEKSVCSEIKCISNLIHQELNGTTCRGTMMQKMFLGYLDAHDGQPVYQKDLESAFHIRRSTASGILQIMVRDGLLVLTPIAMEQLAEMQQDILHVEQKATAGLSAADRKTLFSLLDKVMANLTPSKEE